MADDRDDAGFSERDRLDAILGAAASAIITIDTSGIVRFANAAVERIFGYRPEAVLGQNVAMLMPSEVAVHHDAHIARHVRTGQSRVLGMARNIRGQHADGTTFPVHISVGVMERGGARLYTAIVSDQSAIEVTQTRLSAAIDGIGDGFALFDASGQLAVSNKAHQAFYGLADDVCTPGTMLGDHFAGVDAAADWIGEADAHGAKAGGENEEHRLNIGEDRTVAVRQRFLPNGDRIIATRDVTEATRKSTLLNRAERLRSLGELTGGVAHDFNNMLAVIIGNLELLEPQNTDPEALEMIAEALEAAEAGARLTDRLLAFARRQPLAVEPVSINDMVLDTVPLLKRILGVGIELTLDLAAGLPAVTADRSQLESGLVNLAANARDAMPCGGRLFMETARAELDGDEAIDLPAGSFVRLSIADTGTGIPEAIRSRVFEPFFTTKEKGKGTGLGLSSLYGYCRQIGGALTLYSEVGRGSTFHIYLPLSAKVSDAPRGAAEAGTGPAALSGKTILVVEDDANVRRTTVRRLLALGARVVEAVDAADALRKIEEPGIDAVFSDIVMPGAMDGYALAEALHARLPGLPILLTSGYAEETVNAAQFERAGLPLLRKPHRQADLERAFRQLLG